MTTKNSNSNPDNLIEELDNLLDEEEEGVDEYIGVSTVYRCVSCGNEQVIKNHDEVDVVCDECGGNMQKIDEGIYDAQQKADEEDSGLTEASIVQDKTNDTTNHDKTDDNVGNQFDADETDEIPDLDDLEPSEDELLELESRNPDDILV